MSRHRWFVWLGPPIGLVAVALLLGRFQPGAEAGGRTTPPPVGVCAGAAPVGRVIPAARGTWWRLEDRLDAAGTLIGKTLFAGRGSGATLALNLGPESMASGPVGGLVVVTSDDGRFSDVRLVSAADGCGWLVHRTDAVVRSAVLDPSDGSVLAHLLVRETRADRGVWRITGLDPDATVVSVLEPLAARADIGPIWATELRLDARGQSLAVQSCGERACLTRLVALGGGAGPTVVDTAGQGSILGLTGDALITWDACPGMPCAVLAWGKRDGARQVVVDGAVGAGMTFDGRYLVAVLDPNGRAVRVDFSGKATQRIKGIAEGDLPLNRGVAASAGLEVGSDEVAISAPGADPHAFAPGRAASAP